jgi:peptidoglycan/LPS O-acetylase OafA/YrhL
MIPNYPIAAIATGAVATYVLATVAGTILVRAGFPVPSGDRRIGCVDGLRGYLALSVLVHHFIVWMQVTRLGGSWTAPGVNIFNNLGAAGVALFFMTTGLVFYPRVLTGLRKTSWPATYTTRVFRIVPLIVFSLALITGIIALRTGHRPDSTFPMAAAKWITTFSEPPLLGYTDSGRLNAYVLWTLKLEWYFYIFVLPACAFGRDLIRGWLPSWALPAALLLMALIGRRFYSEGGLPTFLPLFAIGMLAFECQQHSTIRQFLNAKWIALLAFVCLAAGMVSAPTPYGILQLPLFGFFFIVVACGNDLAGLLRTKGALLLGECSYGIYLLHGTILSLLFVDGASVIGPLATDYIPALLPITGLIVACITPVTYLLIERPAIRAGVLIARRLSGRQLRPDDPQVEVAP